MYFADLSSYSYYSAEHLGPLNFSGKRLELVNVGWLDGARDFPTGPFPEDLLDCLFEFCVHNCGAFRFAGKHDCNLCRPMRSVAMVRAGRRAVFGNGEIAVFGPTGPLYIAPNMIYHYVVAHQYEPPGQFIESLRWMCECMPADGAWAERLGALCRLRE